MQSKVRVTLREKTALLVIEQFLKFLIKIPPFRKYVILKGRSARERAPHKCSICYLLYFTLLCFALLYALCSCVCVYVYMCICVCETHIKKSTSVLYI